MIQLTNIQKVYSTKGMPFKALDNVTLEIKEGEFVTIAGPSGSGKSTLLQIIGLLSGYEEGTYLYCGNDISVHKPREQARIRLSQFGFVFQSFYLLNHLTALENVELPLGYLGVAGAVRRKKATQILERVGLADKLSQKPGQLSGGEQQRVAIARALVNSPKLLMADEPTGNLDSENSRLIMELLHSLNREGLTIVLVTHEEKLISEAARLVRLLDGRIV